MANELKIGDVVQLRSGGPKMTITLVGDEHGTPMVWCAWFIGNKQQKGNFPPDTLELYEPSGVSRPFVDDIVDAYLEEEAR